MVAFLVLGLGGSWVDGHGLGGLSPLWGRAEPCAGTAAVLSAAEVGLAMSQVPQRSNPESLMSFPMCR
jgi:hypothetical protein